MLATTECADTLLDKQLTIAVRRTSMGCVGALFDGERVLRVTIGHPAPANAIRAINEVDAHVVDDHEVTRTQTAVMDRLEAALAGKEVDFSDVNVDLSYLRPFARRVAERCRQIPSGQTMTYAELAAACGSPAAARAVGNVMAKNRYPLIVPCHRVVGASGSLGGFSAPNGVEFKRQLLEAENAV